MRNQSSTQSSLDHSTMTIPENGEFSALSTPNIPQDGSTIRQISALSSPSISVTSLSSINASVQQAPKHFRRSQTGTQLLANKPWSRYALRQISLDSSTSSLVSTTSSSAILIPKQNNTTDNKYQTTTFVSSKSACSIFGSDQRRTEEANKRPKSSTLAGFEEKFTNLYSELDEKEPDTPVELATKHRRGYSVWRNSGLSPGKQIRQIMKRSSSTGRLSNNDSNGSQLSCSMLRPPFFAYKVLPYLWIGNIKSASCDDLLSDGGLEYETRLIRRRVYVDFGPEKHHKTMGWPKKQPNQLDYLIPVPRRSKLTKKSLFLSIVEFCKIVNKARRDASQVLAYGHNINLAQLFCAAYLITMFNKTPKTALALIASRVKTADENAPDTLFEWLYDLRSFLDRKSITLGRLNGDIICVKNLEADRAYCKKHIIVRGDELSTPNYFKYINISVERIDVNTTSSNFSTVPPLPLQVPSEQKDWLSDSVDLNQTNNSLGVNEGSEWLNLPQRPKSRI